MQPERRTFWAVCALLAFLALSATAELRYEFNGQEEVVETAQLWYEGHWQQIEWLNGTIEWWPSNNVAGKIVAKFRNEPPHEPFLRQMQSLGATGVVLLRRLSAHPGFSMYIVDGSNRKDIWIPTVEATFKTQHIRELPSGSPISIKPGVNEFKKIADTPFQLILNLILSFWEIAIITIGCYRIWEFYFVGGWAWSSTAPLCCLLEVIGALLRLAYTIVDPFYSYRMIPDNATIILITVSFPFSLAAGILLTFFWAETLNKNNVKAVPFLSSYKPAAIVAVCILFAIEILCDALRGALSGKLAISPNYISIGIYFVVALVLMVCYIITAAAVTKRLGAFLGKGRKRPVRVMTLRVVLSVVGYTIFCISMLGYAIAAEKLWGRQLSLNGFFVGHNWAATCQVIALRPIGASSSSKTTGMSRSGTSGSRKESTHSSHHSSEV